MKTEETGNSEHKQKQPEKGARECSTFVMSEGERKFAR
jgi:hypothetical protein